MVGNARVSRTFGVQQTVTGLCIMYIICMPVVEQENAACQTTESRDQSLRDSSESISSALDSSPFVEQSEVVKQGGEEALC